jgi:hypothetical protein
MTILRLRTSGYRSLILTLKTTLVTLPTPNPTTNAALTNSSGHLLVMTATEYKKLLCFCGFVLKTCTIMHSVGR